MGPAGFEASFRIPFMLGLLDHYDWKYKIILDATIDKKNKICELVQLSRERLVEYNSYQIQTQHIMKDYLEPILQSFLDGS